MLSACTDMNTDMNPKDEMSQIQSEYESTSSDIQSDWEEKFDSSSDTGRYESESSTSSYDESISESSSTVPERNNGKNDEAADAMGNTYSQIALLDGECQGWGHGGPIDEKTNRPTSPETFQKKYEKYNADFIRDDDGNIYLTFDEGYENGYTEKILDVLKEKQAPAVFFVTYDYAKRNPQLIKRMIDEGHIVGNHSYSHPSMPSMSLSEAAEDVKKLHDYIKEEFGYTMTLFRFPKGEFSEQCLALLNEMGYKSVFWSFAYQDWNADNQPDPAESLKKLNESIHSGGIYLLHAVSSTNAEILGDFIDTVRENGLKTAKYE